MTLKLRAEAKRYWNKGVWPHGMPSGGGAPAGGGMQLGTPGYDEPCAPGLPRLYMNRRGLLNRNGRLGGLGDDPETILNSPDPVGLYVTALQILFGMPEEMQTGVWNYETHKAMISFLGDLYGVEDIPRFPGWMQDPGFTGFFTVEVFFGGFDLSGAFERLRPFYAALGLPTTSMRDAISEFTSRGNAARMRQVLDRVNRYVIGCEGGRAYGSPAVKTEGIVAAAGAFVGSVAAVLLVG